MVPWTHLTQLSIPNCISIGSAVLATLTIVTDRQTDRTTLSVAIGCIYTVMRCHLIITELIVIMLSLTISIAEFTQFIG